MRYFVSIVTVSALAMTSNAGNINSIKSECTSLDKESITSVVLPETMVKIPKRAFSACSNLVSVVFPAGLEVVGADAFRGCIALKEVDLPASLVRIDGCAFRDSGLERVVLPESLKTTMPQSFFNCKSLVSVEFKNPYMAIMGNSFGGCSSLREVALPEKLERIEPWVFSDCSSLERVELGEGVKSIGENAFLGCKALRSMRLPASVERVSDTAFSRCSGIDSFAVDVNNTEYIFRDEALMTASGKTILFVFSHSKEYIVPCGVEIICDDAFTTCPALERLIIPGGSRLERCGRLCRCGTLREVVVDKHNRRFRGEGPMLIQLEDEALVDACGLIEELFVLEGTKKIGCEACKACACLKAVALPDSIREIGQGAFSYCRELKEVDLGNGVETVGSAAFLRCGMNRMRMPSSVKALGNAVFSGCERLEVIEFAGNAPGVALDFANPLLGTPEDLLIVVPDGSTGWGEDAEGKLPPTWQDRKIVCKSEYEKMTAASTAK